jgi:MFS family permease
VSEAANSGDRASTTQGTSTAYRGYTLAFLAVIGSFKFLDQTVLGLALPLIKAEMHVSDAIMGLISGFAFALFYSLLGLPIAWIAERWSRRVIITIGFALWSLMTALTAFVANIWQLGVARLVMGAAEACDLAPSYSMVSDLYSEPRWPLALAILGGVASSLVFIVLYPTIGWVGGRYGWRAMFAVCGIPGLVLAALFFLTIREPKRSATVQRRIALKAGSLADMLWFLLGSRAYVLVLVGSAFMGACIYAGGTWNPTFLMRVHHLSLANAATSLGPVQGVFGTAGLLLGGMLTDFLGRRDARWRLMVPAIACLLVSPAELLFLLGLGRLAWMTGLAGTTMLLMLQSAPIFAVAMSVSKVGMRAVAISTMVVIGNLLGQGLGPLLVGMVSDHLHPMFGESAIRYSLLLLVVFSAIGGLAFFAAVPFLQSDRFRAAEYD